MVTLLRVVCYHLEGGVLIHNLKNHVLKRSFCDTVTLQPACDYIWDNTTKKKYILTKINYNTKNARRLGCIMQMSRVSLRTFDMLLADFCILWHSKFAQEACFNLFKFKCWNVWHFATRLWSTSCLFPQTKTISLTTAIVKTRTVT